MLATDPAIPTKRQRQKRTATTFGPGGETKERYDTATGTQTFRRKAKDRPITSPATPKDERAG